MIVVAGLAAIFVTVVVFDAGSIVLLTVFRTVVVVVVDGPTLEVVVGEILFAVAVVADSFEIGALIIYKIYNQLNKSVFLVEICAIHLAVGADDVSGFFSATALGTLGFT